ncbi:glycosyltransferase family 9 protein [Enterovibrio coralii]|nr:glycosyltransferase family 9 protein [Enterovibrio coralii]
MSAIKYLQSLGNFSEIHFGVAPRHADLFKNPAFNNVHVFNAEYRTFKGIIRLFKTISRIAPDYILELSPVRRVGKVVNSHKMLTSSKYSFLSRKNGSISWPKSLELKNCLDTDLNDIWCAFGDPNNLPAAEQFLPRCEQKSVLHNRPWVAMSLASSSEAHIPSIDDFLQLVDIVRTQFPDKKILFPTSSSPLDQSIKKQLMHYKHINEVTFVEAKLEELPSLFEKCCFFVGMDTGIKHLAAFMGLPTFSYIPAKSYPYSHPYLSPHKAVLLGSDAKTVTSDFLKWLNELEN